MMKNKIVLRAIGLTVFLMQSSLLSFAATETSKPAQKAAQKTAWSKKMQQLYALLSELLSDSSSPTRFSAPKNRARIEKNVTELSRAAHSLGKDSPDADPTVRVLATLFADETKRAAQEFRRGNQEYSRTVIQGVSSYCIACHTRSNTGKQMQSLPLEPRGPELTILERGTFFAATRQYDRALAEFRKIIQNSALASQDPIAWERAIRYALAITVRVKSDPDLTLDIADRVLSTPGAPYFMKQDAAVWKKSVTTWKEEPVRHESTAAGLMAEATRLMDGARAQQQYPLDRSADVDYLRASAKIHDLMRKAPDGELLQQAFLMAGVTYEVLRTLNLGELNEIYYEACIRRDPQSPLARTCFERYEQSLYAGYSGSSGTHLPDDLRERLRTLKKMLPGEDAAPAVPAKP